MAGNKKKILKHFLKLGLRSPNMYPYQITLKVLDHWFSAHFFQVRQTLWVYSITLIWNAIYSPKWRKNQRCSSINFFGLITCYRPGSNQIRRNLLLKTYLNNFPWCVNLGEFHFLLKFLNSYVVTHSENQKVLLS